MLRARPGLPRNRTAGWAGRVEPFRRQAVGSPGPTGGWICGDSGERTLAHGALRFLGQSFAGHVILRA